MGAYVFALTCCSPLYVCTVAYAHHSNDSDIYIYIYRLGNFMTPTQHGDRLMVFIDSYPPCNILHLGLGQSFFHIWWTPNYLADGDCSRRFWNMSATQICSDIQRTCSIGHPSSHAVLGSVFFFNGWSQASQLIISLFVLVSPQPGWFFHVFRGGLWDVAQQNWIQNPATAFLLFEN